MGCDIHTSIERRNNDSGRWEELCVYRKRDDGEFEDCTWSMTDDRCYELFGKLAGVRSCEEPLVYPRGIPDDLSESVKKKWEEGEEEGWWHTPTWYDYCELAALSKTPKAFSREELYDVESGECINGDKYNLVLDYIDKVTMVLEIYEVYFPKPGETRIVIWFDS